VLDAFLNDIETGALMFDCGEGDWPRIRVLLLRDALCLVEPPIPAPSPAPNAPVA
jgi:hypothetical protein